jgi:hypothetical protein
MQEKNNNSLSSNYYEESIAHLTNEKKRLEFRLQLLHENKAGKERLTHIFTGIFIFWTILGDVFLLYKPLFKFEGEKFGIYYFVIFCLLLLIAVYRIVGIDKTGVDEIATEILEIDRKIFEIEKNTPHHEMVMNVKESKPKPAPSTISPSSKSTTLSNDEKYCPACAETIKSAAIICRFCGYKF